MKDDIQREMRDPKVTGFESETSRIYKMICSILYGNRIFCKKNISDKGFHTLLTVLYHHITLQFVLFWIDGTLTVLQKQIIEFLLTINEN